MSYPTVKNISLDIYNNSIICVNAKQSDTNRYIEVTCTEYGKKIVLDKNEIKAYVGYTKPDGHFSLNDATVLENGNVQIELTEQMLSVVGKCKADVMLAYADGKLDVNQENELIVYNSSTISTMPFYINVLLSSVNKDIVESSDEYNSFLRSMEKMIALDKALQHNENERQDNEDARKIAENIREQQEAKRIETFRINEENRQSTFETNEENRQDEFDTNETNRINEFSTNETTRQTTFEDNEAVRQSTFDENEESRQNEFDTNETNRINEFSTNETNRQNTFDSNEKTKRQDVFDTNETNRINEFDTNENGRISTFTTNETNRQNIFESNEETRETTFNTSMASWDTDVDNAVKNCTDTTNNAILAEATRKTTFESSMTTWGNKVDTITTDCNNAENLRVEAENNRVIVEEARVESEDSRNLAETTRDEAENGRVQEEENRVIAENLRVEAEDARVLAEQERETNVSNVISECNTVIENADSAVERANVAAEACENIIAGILYPVGSIYMSVNDVNPSLLFGGTWEQIKDTFLLAAGDTYEAGEIGGESEVTLTVDEIPSHSHGLSQSYSYGSGGTSATVGYNPSSVSYNTGSVGNSQPHNNMPPYLTVYMWQRIE